MANHSDLLRLLGDFEDYLTGGFRRSRPEPTAAGDPRGAPLSGADATVHGRPAGSGTAQVAEPAAAIGPPTVTVEREGAPAAEREERLKALSELAAEIAACTRCGLCRGRTHAVPGEGVIDPLVMVVGEGPGADEDSSGRPFVGRAGQYLDKWLQAIQLSRATNAFIANIVKCRPPENRDPLPDEMSACRPFLDRQIALVKPKAILTVGRISSGNLAGQAAGIGRLRGRTFSYRGIPLLPTYHPSGVLRNPEYRAPVWEDLRRLRKLLDEGGSRPLG